MPKPGLNKLAEKVRLRKDHHQRPDRRHDVSADPAAAEEYSVIATSNLNGDYLSDALAAQVGGLGMAPGANMGDDCAVFEATHGSAPQYAGLDKVNPGSLILSGALLLEHIGWQEAADLIYGALPRTISAGIVTYDLARQMAEAREVSCSQFGQSLIDPWDENPLGLRIPSLFFPEKCPLLPKRLPSGKEKSPDCARNARRTLNGSSLLLPPLSAALSGGNGSHLCPPVCRKTPFDLARAAVVYQGKMAKAIQRFKYHGDITLAASLGWFWNIARPDGSSL